MSAHRPVPFLVAQVEIEQGEHRQRGFLVNGWWHRDLQAMVRLSVVVTGARVASETALMRAVREAWDEEMRRRRLVDLQRQVEREA